MVAMRVKEPFNSALSPFNLGNGHKTSTLVKLSASYSRIHSCGGFFFFVFVSILY
jgi:hypothetical protein